jgi:alkylglycerol monooxygenase
MTNFIALAIPFFFVGIGVEAAVAWKQKKSVFRVGDALSSMGCGVAQQITVLLYSGFLVLGYEYIHEHFAIFELEGWVAWVAAFVGVEFAYYWWHRLSHEVNLLWAAHAVHHQSEDYNLSTALRQSITTSLTYFPFLCVLGVLGVPTLQMAVLNSLTTLYQFWIHTELVPPLKRFDSVFNSPSLHRVHHAINPKYLDKNHGGTLMLFDRLFGTYQREEEQCVYGITRPLGSFNPVWAQVDEYWKLFKMAARAPNPLEALKCFVKSPAWKPAWNTEPSRPPVERREQQQKYDPVASPRARQWAIAQFTLLAIGTFSLLMWGGGLPLQWKLGAVGLLYLALFGMAATLEKKAWAQRFETARLSLTAAAGVLFLTGGP